MGMRCEFSRLPFEALLRAGFSIAGLIIPSSTRATDAARRIAPPALPMLPMDIVGLAHALNIPVLEVNRLRSPEALRALEALQPDAICAACFPRLLPRAWLARPRLGAFNLHPSLLPAYRGPEPLFWQFRAGEARTGVTLHIMDEGADSGPIVAQAEVPFADGIAYVEAERLTAEAGARLLTWALAQAEIPRRPQPEAGASLAPHPSAADLIIPADWPARRVFNFARGAEPFGPFTIEQAGALIRVQSALEYTPEGEIDRPAPGAPDTIWLGFHPGAVRFRLAERTSA